MSRRKNSRRMVKPPILKGFKPFGMPLSAEEWVELQYDEYEAVRLCDYQGLGHAEAAERMGISRPTLTRTLESGHGKIAQAFVEGKPIALRGGQVLFDTDWFRCLECSRIFSLADLGLDGDEWQELDIFCPSCQSHQWEHINPEVGGEPMGRGFGRGKGRGLGGQGRGLGLGRGHGHGGGHEHHHEHGHEGHASIFHGDAMGPEGNCICPHCGEVVAKEAGVPCKEEKCPNCGKVMIREGSYHHDLYQKAMEKKARKQQERQGQNDSEADD